MARMTKEQRTINAKTALAGEVLGLKAYKSGKKSVPAWDHNVMDLVSTGEHDTVTLLKGWLKGWNIGNFKNTVIG